MAAPLGPSFSNGRFLMASGFTMAS